MNNQEKRKLQQSTDPFKRWFGDSKVLDKDGCPLVVYHGTNRNINIFRKGSSGYLGRGIYFTDDIAGANHYAERKYSDKVIPVYIRMENPLIVNDSYGTKEFLNKIHGSDRKYDRRKKLQDFDTMIVTDSDIKKLLTMGYDGVIWNVWKASEFVVYNPNQIKHADLNTGRFKLFDNNIYE